MEIISHRGYWLKTEEKNSQEAFSRSFQKGFGTETDIRDRMGELVISHDPAIGGEMRFAEFLALASETSPLLALNVKSDGIAALLKRELEQTNYSNYFVFDMSGPEFLAYKKIGHPTFARVSEFEDPNLQTLDPAGIWFDAFLDDSWRVGWLQANVQSNVKTAIVSPELHGRDHLAFWQHLKNAKIHEGEKYLLCTDLPEAAVDFFGVSND